MLNKVAEGKDTFGYNAATGELGNMIEMGILYPTKVTRTALQNAAWIAGLMITTEAMVAELPKREAPAHDHGGGGMGGMGGMDFQVPLHIELPHKARAPCRALRLLESEAEDFLSAPEM